MRPITTKIIWAHFWCHPELSKFKTFFFFFTSCTKQVSQIKNNFNMRNSKVLCLPHILLANHISNAITKSRKCYSYVWLEKTMLLNFSKFFNYNISHNHWYIFELLMLSTKHWEYHLDFVSCGTTQKQQFSTDDFL